MKSQKVKLAKKVWECIETFPTPIERTKRRWELLSRKPNYKGPERHIKNIEDITIDPNQYNLRYEIWK